MWHLAGVGQMASGCNFRKRSKNGEMAKAQLSVVESEVTFGATAGEQDGCLPFNKCHVVSVCGATPLDRSICEALPSFLDGQVRQQN